MIQLQTVIEFTDDALRIDCTKLNRFDANEDENKVTDCIESIIEKYIQAVAGSGPFELELTHLGDNQQEATPCK